MFYSLLVYSILFYSILFHSILFYPTLTYPGLFYSFLFYSVLFYSILFYSSRTKEHFFIQTRFRPLRPMARVKSTFTSITCVFYHSSVTNESKVPVLYKLCTALL